MIVATDADAEWWGGVSAQAFNKALRSMSGDIEIRINSPGGDIFAAVSMKQAMAEYDGNITVRVDGLAASAASVVAVAADRVVMAPGSMMMIHKAWTIGLGNADDMRATADLLDKADGGIAATYAARGQKPVEEYLALMAAETWMTGEEAVEHGLADEVLPEAREQRRAKAAALWDLTAFDNPPAENPEEAPAEAAAPETDDGEVDDGNVSVIASADETRRRIQTHKVRVGA